MVTCGGCYVTWRGNYGDILKLLWIPRVVCRPNMVTHDAQLVFKNKDDSQNSQLFKAFDFFEFLVCLPIINLFFRPNFSE
jgi:hypothetical protein